MPGLAAPGDLIVTGDGRFVYLAGMVANDPATASDDQYAVSRFVRDRDNGHLVYTDSVVNAIEYNRRRDWDTLWSPTSLALSRDAAQKFLYVAAQSADAINVFRRDDQEGTLTWFGWETEGKGAVTNLDGVQDLIVSRDGRHIYAALDQGDGIAVFDPRAELSIVKKDSADPVAKDAVLTYTLIVTNEGPSDARNVVVTDTLPAGMSFNAEKSSSYCAHDSGTVTCTLSAIPAAATVTVTIEVKAPNAPGSVTNVATVTADQMEIDETNNGDSEDTCISGSDGGDCAANDVGGGPPAAGDSAAPGGAAVAGGGALNWLLMFGFAAGGLCRRWRALRT